MPVTLLNLPGKHEKQETRPESSLLLPNGQASHISPLALLLCPFPHWTQGDKFRSTTVRLENSLPVVEAEWIQPPGQVLHMLLSSRLISPGGHRLHAMLDVDPVASRYLPAEQAWH